MVSSYGTETKGGIDRHMGNIIGFLSSILHIGQNFHQSSFFYVVTPALHVENFKQDFL